MSEADRFRTLKAQAPTQHSTQNGCFMPMTLPSYILSVPAYLVCSTDGYCKTSPRPDYRRRGHAGNLLRGVLT